MATIDPPIPELGVTGSQPATDIVDALEVIRDELNGSLEADNLANRSINQLPIEGASVEVTNLNMQLAAFTDPALPYLAGNQVVKRIDFTDYDDPLTLTAIAFQYTYSKSEPFVPDRLILTPSLTMAYVDPTGGPGTILGSVAFDSTPVNEGPVVNKVRGLSPENGNGASGYGWLVVPQNDLSLLSINFYVSDAVVPSSPALGVFTIHSIKTIIQTWEF